MCPKCGGFEFEIVTLESVLQRVAVSGDSQVHWGEPMCLAILKITELRCVTCGTDFSHDERMKEVLAEQCA